MKQSVLVVGHADADGHLITEQVRRNLARIDRFNVETVVDPVRTKDHKAWTKLDDITEIEDADIVFFVDLMFAPSTFDEEARSLVEFVNDRREKQFFLIDHHPLPLRRLAAADNLRVLYRPDVFECAVGPRSGMMVVAALCEG
jgi:single-stranded DNA-specific DHH superfamily exonuclease